MSLTLATWNVNSIRVRLPHILDWLKDNPVTVLAIQETKITDDAFPSNAFEQAGYQSLYNGQKTYNGVALLVKHPHPVSAVKRDLPNFFDPQKRVLCATVSGICFLNLYVPNGQSVDSDKYRYKLEWLDKLIKYVRTLLEHNQKIILLGDFNIAPTDDDVYDPKAWQGAVLVSEPERQAFAALLALGFHDSFRLFEKAPEHFSWWDYRQAAFRRNRGLRIDHILVSEALTSCADCCQIDKAPRTWDRPSDHAPVVLTLAISNAADLPKKTSDG